MLMKDNLFARLAAYAERVVLGKYMGGTFEQRLTLIGCLTVTVAAAVATYSNFITGLVQIGVITLALSILSAIVYGFARMGFIQKGVPHFIFIIAILFYNLLWFFNFGSHGPMLSTIIGIYVFFTLIWKKRNFYQLVALCCVNIAILFAIEYYWPDLVGNYPSEQIRVVDVYTGFFIAMILTIFLASTIKANYMRQVEKAEKLDRLKTAFLANLSHEVRTPLNVISGFTSMIPEMVYSDEDLEKIHRVIDINGKQLLYLIEDMVDLSKLEIDQLDIVLKPCDIERIFRDLSTEFNYLVDIEKDGIIEISYQLDLPDPVICVDGFRIAQVLRSLVTNSCRFTDSGDIVYGCYEEDKQYIFFVKDSGIGIKPEQEENIFDPFVKFQNRDNTIERGVGIGLSLSKKLVERMGGRMWFQSEVHKGTDFYFSIPKRKYLLDDFKGIINCRKV